MKIFKKIFSLIVILCLLSCGGVLACALNPSLTQSLAAALYGQSDSAGNTAEGSMEGDREGNTESDAEGGSGEVSVLLPGGNGESGSSYVAPSRDSITLPENVSGKNGFEPVRDEAEQIPEDEAESLQDALEPGDTGEEYSFEADKYPYYQMLSEGQQKIYRQIYANAQTLTTSFAPADPIIPSQLKQVFEAVFGDHPELFWMETGYSCKYLQSGQCVEITLKYNSTADRLEQAKQEFQSRARELLHGTDAMTSSYEKERYVHDALASAVVYDAQAEMNQSAYSALVNGRSVCAGYARAFQYLLQQLDIPVFYCTGYSGGDHAWNIVQLPDGYYNVDVTWDDGDTLNYAYFNKTDADYADTHIRQDLSVYLPACNATDYREVDSSGTVTVEDAEESTGETTNGVDEEPDDLSLYINPNPQEPLELPGSKEHSAAENDTEAEKERENLEKAGITKDEVLQDLPAYYADCLEELTARGTGDQFFSNVVPQSLWSSIERAYSTGAYEQGYVADALEKLGVDNFAIQLQLEDLGGGYYRVYHSIVTY